MFGSFGMGCRGCQGSVQEVRGGHSRGDGGPEWRKCRLELPGGERAARHLLGGTELPTAVVAFNDQSAIGVLAALGRAGVAVPGEVSVVGYDDDTLSRLSCFNLTTVSQSAQEQARHAVTAAVERLDQDRTELREVVLTPRLVVRGTTAEPAGPTFES
ncbi:substrate-binding domain-containing protein [Streptomyces sp. NBC_00828]|uniref:substrate-binding domain-containing protein n=1 Tax=Streptomyces sp. NBC_00828 TaxID=2903678 RepID=UPI003868C0A3